VLELAILLGKLPVLQQRGRNELSSLARWLADGGLARLSHLR
jgi:hypothetical protein